MSQPLLVNGEAARLVEVGSWALHGASVFTTVRIESGAPVFWERHLARLASNAAALGLAYPGDRVFQADLEGLLAPRAAAEARFLLRLTITDGGRLAQLVEHVPPPASAYDEGVSAVVTRFRVHPDLASIKSGNYLPYRLARQEAQGRGAFEGLLLDGAGHVVDGSRTSPLLLRGNDLIVLEGGLEGITREAVIAEALGMGLQVGRRSLREAELDGQLLLAGSGVGLLPVGPQRSEAASLLIERFRQHTE